MKQQLAQITLVVRDYDEAIDFYSKRLGFELIEDTPLSETKRWVVVCPKGSSTSILLAKAVGEQQTAAIGNQTGGRVFLFLHTDDIARDHKKLLENNIRIVRGPDTAPYGTVLVFEDLYGNLWDLIQPSPAQG